MKRILLISYNFTPEPTGIGKYNGEMIDWLVKEGYDCTVITSYPYYPFWKVQEPYYKNRFRFTKETKENIPGGGRLTIHRCPMYVPLKPSGLKRILLDFSFFIAAAFKLLLLISKTKFDFVVTIAPAFQVGLLGVLYKKLSKARLVYHIQDLQIEAARDLGILKSKMIINALFKLERYIFEHSDVISSISEGMVDRVREKAKKEVYLFPNWTDNKVFFPLENKEELKREFGFKNTDKVILYSGAIGEKQGLESILYAADEMKQSKEYKFVICGSGPYKEKLQTIAQDLRLSNVVFFPLQPFEKFNKFLNMADVHLVIQKANASDLVMPSKLTTILAVGGLALITANKGAGLHTLVKKYTMGVLVDAENQKALNVGIKRIFTEDLTFVNNNARLYAENELAIDKVMGRFEKLLLVAEKNVAIPKRKIAKEVNSELLKV